MRSFVKPDKNRHKYVIGIDFGHGETSAGICYIDWDKDYALLDKINQLEIFPGRKAIPSVLFIDIDNNIYIGDQAVRTFVNAQHGKFYSCFKKVPSLMSENDKKVMLRFMSEVYKKICSERSELNETNHIVYIACPSSSNIWNDTEMLDYASIALDAGLPLARIVNNQGKEQSIGIIRESRAAFLKARNESGVKNSIERGILLIDFGSSTVDLTYYSSLCKQPIDDGYECGASEVEKILKDNLLEYNKELKRIIYNNESCNNALLFEIRRIKEDYYRCGCSCLSIDINLRKLTKGKIAGHLEKEYSPEEVDGLLHEYKYKIRQAFLRYRHDYLKNKDVKLLFITGGASRMSFVKEIAKEVFGPCDEYNDLDPSLSISDGATLAGRVDMRIHCMLHELLDDKKLVEIQDAKKIIRKGIENITDKVVGVLVDFYHENAFSLNDLRYKALQYLDQIPYSRCIVDGARYALEEISATVIRPGVEKAMGYYFPNSRLPDLSSTIQIDIKIRGEAVLEYSKNCVAKICEEVLIGMVEVFIEMLNSHFLYRALNWVVRFFGFDLNIAVYKIGSFFAKILPLMGFSYSGSSSILPALVTNGLFRLFASKQDRFRRMIYSYLLDNIYNKQLEDEIKAKYTEEVKRYISDVIHESCLLLN